MDLYWLQKRKREQICSELYAIVICRVPKWNKGKYQISEKQKSKILTFKSCLLAPGVIVRTDPLVSTEDERKKLIESVIENITSYIRDIEGRSFFQEMLSALRDVDSESGNDGQRPQFEQMVCYGIGCIHDSRVSQYQYACALRLQSALHIPNVMDMFDPSMDVVGVCCSLQVDGCRDRAAL